MNVMSDGGGYVRDILVTFSSSKSLVPIIFCGLKSSPRAIGEPRFEAIPWILLG